MRISRSWILGLSAAAIVLSAQASSAQPKPARAPTPTKGRAETPKKSAKPTHAAEKSVDKRSGASRGKAAAGASSEDAGVVTARARDGGAREFSFGEVEIEGRLKSPELVYFLRRVRAEFRTRDLGHRSFFPELSESRKEPVF